MKLIRLLDLGSKEMAHLIHQKNIKIKHRLFMTATERLFRGNRMIIFQWMIQGIMDH
jgi:hypothetical protein